MSEPAQKCENNAIQAKQYCKTVYCFQNGLFSLFQLNGKSRFSRFPPKKFYNFNYWSHWRTSQFVYIRVNASTFCLNKQSRRRQQQKRLYSIGPLFRNLSSSTSRPTLGIMSMSGTMAYSVWHPLRAVFRIKLCGYFKLDLQFLYSSVCKQKIKVARGAAIAQWIRLRLTYCRPGFVTQVNRLCFHQFIELCNVEKTKTLKLKLSFVKVWTCYATR